MDRRQGNRPLIEALAIAVKVLRASLARGRLPQRFVAVFFYSE